MVFPLYFLLNKTKIPVLKTGMYLLTYSKLFNAKPSRSLHFFYFLPDFYFNFFRQFRVIHQQLFYCVPALA